jgi:hypothetical protein
MMSMTELKYSNLSPRLRVSAVKSQPRGSVLIFAIVLLSILAMLGTAYLMIIQQSSKASSNAMTNIQADLSAQSGIKHALRILRRSVMDYMIFTPTEVFDPTQPNFFSPVNPSTLTNAVLVNTAPEQISPLVRFQLGADGGPSAVLSDLHSSTVDHFTIEALGSVTNPYDLLYGTPPLDLARQIEMDGSSINEFYPGSDYLKLGYKLQGQRYVSTSLAPINVNVKELPHLLNNGARGRYYVWITDMDSKFYGVPKDWSVDNQNTYDLPVALGWNVNDDPAYLTAGEYAIRQNVLGSLIYQSPYVTVPSNVEQVFDVNTILALDAPPYTQNNNDSRFPNLRTNKELALSLPKTKVAPPPGDPGVPIYEQARSNVDYYLTVYKDTAYIPNQIALKFAKDWSTAININTATPEVIAAALSQIPCDYALRNNWFSATTTLSPGATLSSVICLDNIPLNVHLANRIVAKRPFLCRMDFEDFLAAQILGCIGSDASLSDSSTDYNPTDDGLGDGQVIPPDTDAMWYAYDSTGNGYWDNPSGYNAAYFPATSTVATNPPVVYLLYFSIGRRWGPGNTTFVPGSPWAADTYVNAAFGTASATKPYATPELNLSQWLEIPGVPGSGLPGDPKNHPAFMVNVPSLGTTAGMNTPAAQKLRFRYFVGTPKERNQTVVVEQSLITPKEFNNILNSITAIYIPSGSVGAGQDIQVVAPGTPVAPGTVVVKPGVGTQCYTVPQGDDTIDLVTGNILAGPSGIANTWTPQYRPSYYSFSNDVALADSFWTTLQSAGTPPILPATIPSGLAGALQDYANANPTGPTAFYNGTPASPGPFGDKTISILDPAITAVPITKGSYAGQTIPQLVTTLEQQSKFFYLYRLSPGQPQNPPTYPNPIAPSFGLVLPLETTDMLFWRCRPAVSGSQSTNLTDASPPLNQVATFNARTGLYQMSFDDWTGSSIPPTWDLGTIQAIGDPQASPGSMYSSAKTPTILDATGNWVHGNNDGSGLAGNGDANWSPQFCFRSRYFGIYVLGRGMVQGGGGAQYVGERRLEAVYDAIKDELLWQRSPQGEVRALGDP